MNVVVAATRAYPQPEGDRPVVDQGHPHARSESAGLDLRVAAAGGRCKRREQCASGLRVGRGGETRPGALAGIGRQGELGDQQQPAAPSWAMDDDDDDAGSFRWTQ